MLANASGLESIDLDTDIIENRLIDSLQFVSFLLFIEEVRGQEIPEAEVKLDSLRTLRSIRDNFLLERR
jgi:acyl carrier protein